MGPRQHVTTAPLLDGKLLWTIGAVELTEAVHRDARGAGDELQHTGTHLIVEAEQALPKVVDCLAARAVAALVDRVSLPIFDVNLLQAAHQQLHLVRVEDAQQIRGNHLKKELIIDKSLKI